MNDHHRLRYKTRLIRKTDTASHLRVTRRSFFLGKFIFPAPNLNELLFCPQSAGAIRNISTPSSDNPFETTKTEVGMKVLLMALMLVMLGACVDDSVEESIRMNEAELGKGDTQARIIGRGLKLGVTSTIEVLSDRGWVIHGRSNLDLTTVQASVAGRDQRVEVVSSGFQVHLDDLAYQDLLVEMPLQIEASSAEQSAALTVHYAARWVETRGSRKLKFERSLQPVVLQGGIPALRAYAQTNDGFALESVFTDDDLEPKIFRDFDWKWQMEWNLAQAALLSDFQEDRVYFLTADSDDTRYRTTAKVRLRAVEQVWTRSPEQEETAECDSSTRFCMHHLLPDARDASECGSVQEVLACFRYDAR